MKLTVRHELKIGIAPGSARAAVHLLLTPQQSPVQTVREWRLDAEGLDGAGGSFLDAYGNRAQLLTQSKPGEAITIVATGLVETREGNGVLGRLPREPVPALFRRVTPLTEPDEVLVEEMRPLTGSRIGLLHALMAAVVVPPPQVQAQDAEGQTQSQGGEVSVADAVHAFIATCRGLDIPARFITGYVAAGAEEPAYFHAWAEAFDDGLGWICFDPKLQLCPTDRHIRVAVGLDAISAAPARAVPAMGDPETVSVTVAPES